MTTHMEKQKLPTKIGASRLDELAKEQAELQLAVDKKKAIKKASVAEINAALKVDQQRLSEIAQSIHDGTELVEIEVVERKRYQEKLVEYVRTDTNEVIESREMDADDLQEQMAYEGKDPNVQPTKGRKGERMPRRGKKAGELTAVADEDERAPSEMPYTNAPSAEE